MPERLNTLQQWLETSVGFHAPQIVAITNDASFRRYFRVTANANTTHIAMDAPPERENCQPFVDVAHRLRASGLNAPEIIVSNLEQGFLLLTDFGSQLYLPALTETQVERLYGDALDALVTMQARTPSDGLPLYDHRLLHQEMALFTDWLVDKHLNHLLQSKELTDLRACFELLSDSALSQPQVFVHRDYHSRNLMVVPSHNPGILDFQDAVKGPVTYDLVSLLRDCYVVWPLERVTGWAKRYYTQAQAMGILNDVAETEFFRWFDWMGIQRHLKASGIFARLYHRDGKAGYLQDIPRTLNYIVEVGQHYPELAALHELVSQRVLPALS
jgi:hypothetical protein